MKIRLLTLDIVSFSYLDVDHFVFREEIAHDKKINRYLTNLRGRLKEIENDTGELQWNTSYIVKDNDNLIGYLRLEKDDPFLEMHYAVHSNFRSLGYGEKMLGEITEYMLDNHQEFEALRLRIAESNDISRHIAIKNGYQYHESDKCYYKKR